MKISVTDKDGREKISMTNIVIEAENEGKTLLSILQENQVYIDAPCNGKGTCGKCKVRYSAGAEQEAGYRLACQIVPDGDCTVQLASGPQIRAAASGPREHAGASGPQIRAAASGPREHAGASGPQIHQKTDAYGIAIDIGTTTLAAALVHLPTGTRVGVMTGINHQRMYGADVIARIQAANEGKLGLLQKTLHSDLRQIINALLTKAQIAMHAVKKIVIAGNTAMCHFLLGYSCRTLGTAPFTPVDISLTKKNYLSAEVVILPGVSAFIGADIVAGLYAGGIAESKEDTLFLDIGTNGEMVIGNSGGFLATAAAAGPVFEGGEISCGVPGVAGAVSHISLNPDASIRRISRISLDSDASIRRINRISLDADASMCRMEQIGDGSQTTGLCGSGIIDLVGELVRNQIVDAEGLLKEPWFSKGLPIGSETLRFLQSDIRKFQMGKAAIRTGIEILLNRYYGRHELPSRICLAGGFGYYMDIKNAVNTGLFPPDFADRVEILGNSALEGAVRCLTEDEEAPLTEIVRKTEVMNLAEEEDFFDAYVEYMRF